MSVTSTQLLKVFKELERRIAAIDVRQGGPEGQRGPVGPKGRKGDKGPKGDSIVGPKGDKGAQGPTGPAGRDGKDGKDGKQGPIGPQGPRGADGRDGLNGAHGRDGKDGVSVTDVQIDFDGRLTVQLSDGTEIDAGMIDNKAGDTIVYSGGGSSGGGGGGDVPPHNQLTGLQGGTTNQYYHLTASEHATLIDWANNGLPEFAGSGTSGVVPDPITESGRFLRDDGTWASGGGGGGGQVDSVVGGNAITVDATDPVNPVVNADEFTGANTKGVVVGPAAQNNFFLRDDGTFAAAPVSPIGALFLNMRWNSGTVADDPGSGEIKANNVDQTLATELYVSDTTQPGNNADFIYQNVNPGEFIGLWAPTSNEQVYYVVTGPLVDNGTWWTIPVSRVSGDGGFANNNQIQEFFLGDPNEKIPTGGTTGQVLTKLSNDDYDDAWQDPQSVYWSANGDDIYNNNAGNVGIGTTDPINVKLDVRGVVSGSLAAVNQAAMFGNDTDAVFQGTVFDSFTMAPVQINGSQTVFQTGTGALNLAERMRIDGVGNVGIGTTGPIRRLSVTGNGTSQDVATLDGAGAASTGLTFTNGLTTAERGRIRYDNADAMQFHTAAIERMRIDGVGNVGIGTGSTEAVADQTTLAVNGTNASRLSLYSGGVKRADLASSLFSTALQTTEAVRLVFGTNSVERIRIEANGNVGIGTPSPLGKLHVQAATGSVGRAGVIQQWSGNVNSPERALILSDFTSNGTVHSGFDLNATSTANGTLTFSTMDEERMRIASTGNVGINDTAPSQLLSIKVPSTTGAASAAFKITAEAGGTADWARMDLEGAGQASGLILFQANIGLAQVRNLASGKNLNLVQDGAGYINFNTNGAERLRIDSAGNVGIGTSSPGNLLTVSKTGGSAGMALNATTTGSSEFIQRGGDSVARHVLVAGGQTAYVDSFEILQGLGGSAQLLLRGNADMNFTTNNVERMRITSTGVVRGLFTGVGVTQNQSKFQVVSALPGTPDANTIYFVV